MQAAIRNNDDNEILWEGHASAYPAVGKAVYLDGTRYRVERLMREFHTRGTEGFASWTAYVGKCRAL